jgi:hypothetical protein
MTHNQKEVKRQGKAKATRHFKPKRKYESGGTMDEDGRELM